MMHKLGLADALAETREEIARLREREEALKSAIMAFEGNVPDGQWSRVELIERHEMVFDKDRLPENVRENPRFWREKVTTLVRSLPTRPKVDRPGWPIQRVGELPH